MLPDVARWCFRYATDPPAHRLCCGHYKSVKTAAASGTVRNKLQAKLRGHITSTIRRVQNETN